VVVPGGALDAFDQITRSIKALQFQLARAMTRKRPLDLAPLWVMAEQWASGIELLRGEFG
jgi:hypothetical protein